MSELKVNTITEASTGTGITFTNSIVSGNLGTITQRSASSSSPTFTRSIGDAIDSTVLGNLYGSTSVQPNGTTNTTHGWIAWDYGSGNARKLTKLRWLAVDGAGDSTGTFLEGSNVASPNAGAGHSDWTQLKSFGNIVNDTVYSYTSPVIATTLKYRHYRIRWAWSGTGNWNQIHSFILEDTDSTFDARTALNATGSAPIYACRAWVNFDGTTGSGTGQSNITIRGSGNVSSITDNGSADYTVNFTTAMEDNDYACLLSGVNRGKTSSTNYSVGYYSTNHVNAVDYNSGSVRILNHMGNSATMTDTDTLSVAIFR